MSSQTLKHVAVIGSGLMGSGIAQVTANAGYKVTLVDQSDAALSKAIGIIKTSLARVVKKKFEADPAKGEQYLKSTLERISTTSQLEQAAESDLIIEAIVENLQVKHELFAKLDKLSPAHTIFTSNTSSLPISEIAKPVSAARRERFGGLHFFNPVPMMKLLEVIRLDTTQESVYQQMIEYGKSIGKVTVKCKDTPGFIVNRLLVPYSFEAVRMFERGDASFQDIDTAMKLGAGLPMGPFELTDYTGLDTGKFVQDGWHARFPDNPLFKPSPLLNKLVSENKLGRKTGQGFYKYPPPTKI